MPVCFHRVRSSTADAQAGWYFILGVTWEGGHPSQPLSRLIHKSLFPLEIK